MLRALLVCLCLVLLTQAASANGETAASAAPAASAAKHARARKAHTKSVRAVSLEQRVARMDRAVHRHRSTIRFYRNHPRLVRSTKHRATARTAVRRANRGLARAQHSKTVLQQKIARREARRLAKAPPKTAICHVLGRRYCREALAVSWCESRHSTTAENGQYLGLFQMGSYERQLFGHGHTAFKQAQAAHEYFVLTDRDWSPWSCKPWYRL